MGLDMYLTRRTYTGNKWRKEKEQVKIKLPKTTSKIVGPIDHIKQEKVSYIEEEIGYWRKANAIHKWFVENVQDGEDDCKEYVVNKENIEKLLKLCKLTKENPKMARKFLPTASGFFFGDVDYDEYYFECINDTIKFCEEALKSPNVRIIYSSSW